MDPFFPTIGIFEILVIVFSLGLPVLLSISALFSLRKLNLSGAALGLWVLIICAIPYLGAIAFWIVCPRGNETRE